MLFENMLSNSLSKMSDDSETRFIDAYKKHFGTDINYWCFSGEDVLMKRISNENINKLLELMNRFDNPIDYFIECIRLGIFNIGLECLHDGDYYHGTYDLIWDRNYELFYSSEIDYNKFDIVLYCLFNTQESRFTKSSNYAKLPNEIKKYIFLFSFVLCGYRSPEVMQFIMKHVWKYDVDLSDNKLFCMTENIADYGPNCEFNEDCFNSYCSYDDLISLLDSIELTQHDCTINGERHIISIDNYQDYTNPDLWFDNESCLGLLYVKDEYVCFESFDKLMSGKHSVLRLRLPIEQLEEFKEDKIFMDIFKYLAMQTICALCGIFWSGSNMLIRREKLQSWNNVRNNYRFGDGSTNIISYVKGMDTSIPDIILKDLRTLIEG